VIFQAGVSEDGRNLAAHVAEGIYAPGGSLTEAQAYHADIKQRAAALGRDPDHIIILIGASPVVADTDERARERDREIYEEDNDFDRKLAFLGRSFGAYDFTQHDLDEPFPDLTHLTERGRRGGADLVRRAREQGLTLRQVAEAASEYRPGQFVGAPETVADALQHWFVAKATDGFNLRFRTIDALENFVGTVVPILQKRGAFRTEYESDTLRGNLGLPIPVNRYTAERELARANA
jgi:alkanesulfonate monooxygenase SsuD/methylene tetrahydromethanopterin reductase-like flavin-dependent oxidoreductase (luciferase family)